MLTIRNVECECGEPLTLKRTIEQSESVVVQCHRCTATHVLTITRLSSSRQSRDSRPRASWATQQLMEAAGTA